MRASTRRTKSLFTVRDVFAQMAAGTSFAESTVFKTMQRMKEAPERPPNVRLERAGRANFRVVLAA
jgi:hypothetical protein